MKSKLPKPYYEDEFVKIYHGESSDLLWRMPTCGAVITDPPYSERTHKGNKVLSEGTDTAKKRKALEFEEWTEEDVNYFIPWMCTKSCGWVVTMTDDELLPYIKRAYRECGFYEFGSVPFVNVGGRIRLCGDGPSSWVVFILVARPKTREFSRWGTLSGAYIAGQGWRDRSYIGGKPIQLCEELIHDYYLKRIDLVGGLPILDPFMGFGTLLRAAKNLKVQAIGIDKSEKCCKHAAERMQEPSLLEITTSEESKASEIRKQLGLENPENLKGV
jgi:site-specific DNA-methyltransferase (adenine-specific)